MNDEKTTEIELPPAMTNIVRVNFTERRKVARPPQSQKAAIPARRPPAPLDIQLIDVQWRTPLWVRVAALAAILALSLFVL